MEEVVVGERPLPVRAGSTEGSSLFFDLMLWVVGLRFDWVEAGETLSKVCSSFYNTNLHRHRHWQTDT